MPGMPARASPDLCVHRIAPSWYSLFAGFGGHGGRAQRTLILLLKMIPGLLAVESVEDNAGLPHELSVILEQLAQTPHGLVEPRRLQPVELVVLEVYVVDDLGQPSEGRVAR